MDQDAILSTAAGNVWLSPALMAVAPPDVAFAGMRELHFAALGATDYPFETDAVSLLPDEARSAYAAAYLGLTGQVSAITPTAADRLLSSMCDHADLYSGFDGLESIAFSALLTGAEGGRETPVHQRFQDLLREYGVPPVAGGGYDTGMIVERASGYVGFPQIDQLRDATTRALESGGSPRSLVDAGIDLAARGVGVVLGNEAQAAFGHAARELGTVLAATALGAELGSTLGPAGTLAGALIGFFVGLFANDTPHQREQRHDAAKDVAHGTQVVVHGHTAVEVHGTPQVAARDGQCKPAPADAHTPQHPRQGVVVEPSHHKCDVGEEAVLPGDYRQPFWGDTATLIGSGATAGTGLDATFSTRESVDGGIAFHLAGTPRVDEAGLMVDGGFALAAIHDELPRSEPLKAIGEDPWADVAGRLLLHHRRHPATVPDRDLDVARVVVQLGRLRVDPADHIGPVLRRLHRDYGI